MSAWVCAGFEHLVLVCLSVQVCACVCCCQTDVESVNAALRAHAATGATALVRATVVNMKRMHVGALPLRACI